MARPHDDWYDDEDDGDFPVRASSNRGRGLLISAAVLSFVMSAFNAILASIFFLCGSFFGLLGMAGGDFLPPDMMRDRAVVTLIFAFFGGVSFLLQIFAGVGLLRERSWSRTLAIGLAVYAILAAAFFGYAVFHWIMADNANDEGWIALGSAVIFFHLGYAIPTLALLNATAAVRRFKRNSLDD